MYEKYRIVADNIIFSYLDDKIGTKTLLVEPIKIYYTYDSEFMTNFILL